MKHALVVLFLAAAAIPTLPTTQQRPNRVSLELGPVTVWLGMPKNEFMAAAKAAGYKVYDSGSKDGDVVMTLEHGSQITKTYTLRFDNSGLLNYASREWPDTNRSPYEAMLGALKTVDGQHCTISHQPLNNPNNNLDRVFVFCDSGRTLLIMYGKISVSPTTFGAVYERIEAE